MENLSTVATEREQRLTQKEFESYFNRDAEEFILGIRKDLRSKWDRIVIVTGERGVGKSVMSITQLKLIDYTFNFGRLAFSPEDIVPILSILEPYQGMQLDEGGEVWARNDWATSVSKLITKQFIGDRYLHACRYILAPTIFHLDKKAVDMAHYWIRVYSPDKRLRGYAELREIKEKDYYDPKLPFAPPIGDIEFDDLPKEIAKVYEGFKAKKGRERSKFYGGKIDDKIHGRKREYISPDEVAEIVARSPGSYTKDGKFNADMIFGEFSDRGLGVERARAIASWLNNRKVL